MTLSETLKYSGLVAERYELASVAEKLFGTKQLDVTAGADQGWSGVGLPEELGGSGGDGADLAPILEAAGSTCAAAPLAWSTGVVGQLFSHDAEMVSAISSGADVALPLASAGKLAAEITLEDGRLRGEFLVIGTGGHGVLVPFESDGAPCAAVLTDVPVENLPGLDQTRSWGRVRLDGVSTSGMAVVSAPDLFFRWETKMAQAFALDAAGAARSALRRTIEYSLTREQFGRPIGSFQAYKHRLADMYMHLKLSQSLAFRAAAEAGEPASVARANAAALYGTSLATRICGEAVQLHGGIGFTWEAGLHEFLKRSRADQVIAQGQGSARDALSSLS